MPLFKKPKASDKKESNKKVRYDPFDRRPLGVDERMFDNRGKLDD